MRSVFALLLAVALAPLASAATLRGEHVVLRAPAGRVIGFDCWGGTPDEPIDCDAIIRQVVRTLRLAP